MSPDNFHIWVVLVNAIGILITNGVVVGGWLFSIIQNKAALRRRQRVSELAIAYEVFVRAGIDKGKPGRIMGDGNFFDYSLELQSAVSTIHLYGSNRQIKLANDFVNSLSDNSFYSPEELITEIRSDIRSQMKMEPVKSKISWLVQSVNDVRDDKARASVIRIVDNE